MDELSSEFPFPVPNAFFKEHVRKEVEKGTTYEGLIEKYPMSSVVIVAMKVNSTRLRDVMRWREIRDAAPSKETRDLALLIYLVELQEMMMACGGDEDVPVLKNDSTFFPRLEPHDPETYIKALLDARVPFVGELREIATEFGSVEKGIREIFEGTIEESDNPKTRADGAYLLYVVFMCEATSFIGLESHPEETDVPLREASV